jgi:hypothetical protein
VFTGRAQQFQSPGLGIKTSRHIQPPQESVQRQGGVPGIGRVGLELIEFTTAQDDVVPIDFVREVDCAGSRTGSVKRSADSNANHCCNPLSVKLLNIYSGYAPYG